MMKLLAVLGAGWLLLPLLDSWIVILGLLIVATMAMGEGRRDK